MLREAQRKATGDKGMVRILSILEIDLGRGIGPPREKFDISL